MLDETKLQLKDAYDRKLAEDLLTLAQAHTILQDWDMLKKKQ
jgi:hypothetical protein